MAEAAEWNLVSGPNGDYEEALTDQLVAYNKSKSAVTRERFLPENLQPRPVEVYATKEGELVGGCVGKTADVWHWLAIDTLWVLESARGQGLGSVLLDAVEQEARERGCRWSHLSTFDFQAPGFYQKAGYVEFGRLKDYPPGHINFFLRKDL